MHGVHVLMDQRFNFRARAYHQAHIPDANLTRSGSPVSTTLRIERKTMSLANSDRDKPKGDWVPAPNPGDPSSGTRKKRAIPE